MSTCPAERVRCLKNVSPNRSGDYVLYWMVANRRARWNYSLDRAIEWCQELNKPLLVFEALRCDYRWASDRLHHFVVQGMNDNSAMFAESGVTYFPYVEPEKGHGRGLLKALAKRAAVLVSDDYPCFFLPSQHRAAARQVDCRYELVDSNGLLPMRAVDKTFARAFDFRRFLQKNLRPYLEQAPRQSVHALPSSSLDLSTEVTPRWRPSDVDSMASDTAYLAKLPIDHAVSVAPGMNGGYAAAREQLDLFIDQKLHRYGTERSEPEADAASGLSPWLHFGHISAHEIFAAVATATDWSVDKLSSKTGGASRGWWGIDEAAESFLDELITWRELGFNMCSRERDYENFESLPEWAQKTLHEHASDDREHEYTLEQFEQAETHDDLWNAAQWQLVTTGRMHNYLRMLWGKKILEWSASPQDALETMVHLNNKYAIDGRDPNSYSGIFWVLGRYDRAWGPERNVFGKIRYMSSDNTKRKFPVKNYIHRYTPRRAEQTHLFE